MSEASDGYMECCDEFARAMGTGGPQPKRDASQKATAIGSDGTRKVQCPSCMAKVVDAGRATDGRRAYRCKACGHIWTKGMQGREQRFSPQRIGYQFCRK